MTTTVSEIRVWSCATSTDRVLLEQCCANAAENGGSFQIEFLGTRVPHNYLIQRYTINWPDAVIKPFEEQGK